MSFMIDDWKPLVNALPCVEKSNNLLNLFESYFKIILAMKHFTIKKRRNNDTYSVLNRLNITTSKGSPLNTRTKKPKEHEYSFRKETFSYNTNKVLFDECFLLFFPFHEMRYFIYISILKLLFVIYHFKT